MPMIDIYAPEGTFPEANEASLLERATSVLLQYEKTTNIPFAVSNTGAYLHVLPKSRVAAGGKADKVVRIQLLTPKDGLQQPQRSGITEGMTKIVGELAADPKTAERTWVLFSEAVDGGWGVAGTAYNNAELFEVVKASAIAARGGAK
jgi:phenylpyruvate tautomerase PptA (4-oxalocrotonate tautomerase family)